MVQSKGVKSTETQINDAEYLQRDEIAVSYIISDKMVCVHSDNTSFVHVITVNPVLQKDCLQIYQEILDNVRKLKALGNKDVKISYKYHTRERFLSLWPAYAKECKEAQKVYNNIKKQAKVVQQRGIHFGCVDDKELTKLTDLKNKYATYFYRTTNISQLESIVRQWRDALNTLNEILNQQSCIVGATLYL